MLNRFAAQVRRRRPISDCRVRRIIMADVVEKIHRNRGEPFGKRRAKSIRCGLFMPALERRLTVRLSTRNQLTGTVATLKPGSVMTVVTVDLDGGQHVTSSITRDAAEDLALEVGMPVTVLVKSTEVMLGVE
jgi:molybdate transport system regulatory protein